MKKTDIALSEEELRTAVVPPPPVPARGRLLCRDCRFCRPKWGLMTVPTLWPFPYIWRQMWESAECRHPTSLRPPPPPDVVTGRRRRPSRMSCAAARAEHYRGKSCGPAARYWQARAYPRWLWTAGPIALGTVLTVVYVAALWFVFREG